MNNNPTLSNAGTWVPVTDNKVLSSSYNGTLANTFHAVISLGSNGYYGMVVSGWGYSGWPPALASTAPVSMALLTPDANGNLSINTAQYITDPVTNGSGSAIVADFNGDGRNDIVLLAHNESPFIPMPSTAWLSNANGGFTKVTLNDLVMAHDAELVHINGQPAIASATFTTDDHGNPMAGALRNPIYTYSNGVFVVSSPANVSNLGGMDTTIVNSGGTVGLEIARGDVGGSWTQATGWDAQNINLYAFNGTDVTSMTPVQSIVPYLSTLPQYASFPSQIGGTGLTHTYRLWSEDLNNDGKQDILAGESMWSQTNPDFPSALQVLINRGDGTFKDETAMLNAGMGLNTSEMDYNPNFVDLDHSGIKTLLFAGSTSWGSMARQADYVLLNDGTGHLYVALHDQFASLAQQVFAYLGMWHNDSSTPPRFIAIPQPDGSLNFVAEISTSVYNSAVAISQTAYQYVNVPLHYNPTSDYTASVNIADRNGSKLMRTWAGNDSFGDANANASPAHLDGGLGIDTAVYSKAASSYLFGHGSDGSVSVTGNGLADTLVNIERLQFADKKLAVDVSASGSAGETALLMGAVLPGVLALDVSKQALLGSVIALFDAGYSLKELSGAVLRLPIWDLLTGHSAPSNTDIASYLLANVNGHSPDQATLSDAVTALNTEVHQGDWLAALAMSAAGQTHIDLVGLAQTGLAYS